MQLETLRLTQREFLIERGAEPSSIVVLDEGWNKRLRCWFVRSSCVRDGHEVFDLVMKAQ